LGSLLRVHILHPPLQSFVVLGVIFEIDGVEGTMVHVPFLLIKDRLVLFNLRQKDLTLKLLCIFLVEVLFLLGFPVHDSVCPLLDVNEDLLLLSELLSVVAFHLFDLVTRDVMVERFHFMLDEDFYLLPLLLGPLLLLLLPLLALSVQTPKPVLGLILLVLQELRLILVDDFLLFLLLPLFLLRQGLYEV